MSDLENSHKKAIEAEERRTKSISDSWERELRPALFIPKSHWIDQMVLTTRLVVREALRFRKISAAARKWHHDVNVAKTLGIAEPPLWDYISEDDLKPIERSSLSS